jgi:hypothetical protein
VATGSFLAFPLSTSRRKPLSGGRDVLLSDEHTWLRPGDRILFTGEAGVTGLQRRTLNDDGTVH